MRPIDADKLIAQLEEDVKHIDDAICQMMTYAAINDVKKQPTIDIAERRGSWIYPTDIIGFGRCGNCKALWDIGLIRNKFFRYCPRCGAEMITDKDDTQ